MIKNWKRRKDLESRRRVTRAWENRLTGEIFWLEKRGDARYDFMHNSDEDEFRDGPAFARTIESVREWQEDAIGEAVDWLRDHPRSERLYEEGDVIRHPGGREERIYSYSIDPDTGQVTYSLMETGNADLVSREVTQEELKRLLDAGAELE